MEFGLSQSDALSREEATRRMAAVYQSDGSVELGVAGADQVYWRRSRLVHLVDLYSDPIVVAAPQAAQGASWLRVGWKVLLYRHEEVGGLAFLTTVVDLGSHESGGGARIPTASLAPAVAVYRYQRRSAVRLTPPEPVRVACDARSEAGSEVPVEGPSGVLEDISRGGACVRFDQYDEEWFEQVPLGAVLRVSLPAPDPDEPLGLLATVARRLREQGPRGALRLGLRWRSLAPDQRTELAYYVTECERAMLQIRRRRVEVRGEEAEEGALEDARASGRSRLWRRTARGGSDSGPGWTWRRGFEPAPAPDEPDETEETDEGA